MIASLQRRPHGQYPTNAELAERLEAQADRIAEHDENPYHITAYRRGAETLRSLQRPAANILEEQGRVGLEQLPGIGKSLARRIERIIEQAARRGYLAEDPQQQFTTIGSIGRQLARRIHEQLAITTLAELSAAAYDGRLARVPGIGPKRLRSVREALTARVGRISRLPRETPHQRKRVSLEEPPIETLLDIDREYRRLAVLGKLPKMAPKRYNPTGEAWLPILHTEVQGERYTACYSNTARAHELGTTDDWVVIHREEPLRGQWTVVTGQFGALRGRRVVCGRDKECSEFYAGNCCGPAQSRGHRES